MTSCGLNLYSELLARILICILTILLARIQIWVLNSIKGFTQPLFIFSYRSNYSWSCARIQQIMHRTLYKRQYYRASEKIWNYKLIHCNMLIFTFLYTKSIAKGRYNIQNDEAIRKFIKTYNTVFKKIGSFC